ncbi:hypothetical protein, partial [Mesotoga sp.]|uniref:protein kinase domain-containing protein n=1 Tax=Mesotoga sp. TaxID=2053577 RepID=UPI00345E5E0D
SFSIEELGEAAYKEVIEEALDKARIMVVVGTTKENLNSKWVKYEWDSFHNEIISGRKKGGKIFTLIDNLTIKELPLALRQNQAFPISRKNNLLKTIMRALGANHTSISSKTGSQQGKKKTPSSRSDSTFIPEKTGSKVVKETAEWSNHGFAGFLLREGQMLEVRGSGMTCEVISFLGGGGQGEVYKGRLDGREVAVKWYFPDYLNNDHGLRYRLEGLIRNGAPNDKFLWPMDIVTSQDDSKSFGYIMELRENRFKSIIDLMKRRIEPKLHVLTIVGFELAFNFRELHKRGLCYRDISYGNVFFDPKNGEVRICDNDNVDLNGMEGAIIGTPRFLAPEIVRGEAQPTISTDLFSLSVLLFYILMFNHPLEGYKESSIQFFDLSAQRQLYGFNPIFIYDPQDKSNRPDPNVNMNAIKSWPIYPRFLQDMFIKAFTEGLRNPESRIREGEWIKAFAHLRDCLYYCSNCGEENFRDFESTRTAICWSCKKPTKIPMSIVIEKNLIAITSDMKLYPHHIERDSEFDFIKPQARVARHPTDPNKWGIKNLSPTVWTATAPDGKELEIDPGRSISIVPGTKINFGNLEGEIIL